MGVTFGGCLNRTSLDTVDRVVGKRNSVLVSGGERLDVSN